jgi:2-dehydropantoate 2-reductase
MRFVVYGAGAVGGVVGAQLCRQNFSVVLIARGEHGETLQREGLTLETPDGSFQIRPPVYGHPSHIEWQNDDIVLLAVKSQDTSLALDALATTAPPNTPVLCLQNGVANERLALRKFSRVYAVFVYCLSGHLTPGVVQAWCAPTRGILDVGRYPSGIDALCKEATSAFRASQFYSEARIDIMRWKYRKLLMNLGNAVEALCGRSERRGSLVERARREGADCLAAAGIAFASEDEEPVLRERQLPPRTIGDQQRPGGSTWQSLARHTRSVEVDYLNGEIVQLGRVHGVKTPVNELLQRLSGQAAAEGRAPGSMTVEDIESMLS